MEFKSSDVRAGRVGARETFNNFKFELEIILEEGA